ncbi:MULTISPECIES: multiubiquitin domain-containing protein [Sphingobium]|uniref:multiubiquitin domain-containing protein n=1 Tax=Sphingobium TaxID=165695 RepID=UPI0015EC42AD|nr:MULTISPECIES: multiubiquitin domain-containing protein [Sphingobium]MCW2363156.1 hypothetical protein [Sphingobium sp. B10D3B]MCW2400164.1 hypothetical protein [Sphingobium sp. B10D7B]MCW2407142.1 hypothetical protein [Sphingobium xanthum]
MNQQIGRHPDPIVDSLRPGTPDPGHGKDGGKQTTEIIVNARERSVRGEKVTFEQIVRIAFPQNEPQPGQPFVYSMTYRRAASIPHAGELGPGGIVTVKKGTIFNVTRTVQS